MGVIRGDTTSLDYSSYEDIGCMASCHSYNTEPDA